jgi:outer membrane protein assembly factor BamB
MAALGAALAAAPAPPATEWNQFRGPEGNGIARVGALPLEWSETRNVRWKTAVHGRAWSSPVVSGGQVWMTTATEDGRRLYAVALDRESGRVLHDLELFQVAAPQYAHPANTYASPTPVVEKGRLYVTFGSPGTAALDTATGQALWTRRDIECNHFGARDRRRSSSATS